MADAKPEQHEALTPVADPERAKEPGDVPHDKDLKLKLVWCPQGSFKMGAPKAEGGQEPIEVTLTRGYWLGQYEVTQSEWRAVMNTEPWKDDRLRRRALGGSGPKVVKEGADFPATFISWDDVIDFCRKLTERERQAGRLSNDWEYTLPTEAQWEYACQAGTETKFSFGDDESKFGEYAWFAGNTRDNRKRQGEAHAHRVGQKKPNPWGLYDMHGNVKEWCRAIYTETLPGGSDPEVNPDERTEASTRLVRGGGWFGGAFLCTSAFRGWASPSERGYYQGFRIARSPVP
jgi:formylglycine-generating enzyme required for sulfatase activity